MINSSSVRFEDVVLRAVFVVGDSMHTEVVGESKGIAGAITVMLCLDYIFNLAYPRRYSMFMALLLWHSCLHR